MSTKATAGARSQTRRSASAVVAAGPETTAPHDSSSIFNPVPTSQESSTMRTHSPSSSKELASGGSQTSDDVMPYRPGVSAQSYSLTSRMGRRNPQKLG